MKDWDFQSRLKRSKKVLFEVIATQMVLIRFGNTKIYQTLEQYLILQREVACPLESEWAL